MSPPSLFKNRACRRWLALASLILLADLPIVSVAVAAQTLPPTLQPEFEKGVAAVQAGHLDEAERAFLHILSQGGKASFVYNNLGIVYQMRGYQARAIVEFREAIRLQPDYAAPRILLGASLTALGRNAEAVRELERAVAVSPNEPLGHVQLAEAYQHTRNYAGAVEQYRALRALQADDPEYRFQLGRAYFERAKWCVQEIRKIDPNAACLYETLAENYRTQGHLGLALIAYRRALSVEPKRPGIHLALAQIQLELGNSAEARKESDEELAITPYSIAALAVTRKIESHGKE